MVKHPFSSMLYMKVLFEKSTPVQTENTDFLFYNETDIPSRGVALEGNIFIKETDFSALKINSCHLSFSHMMRYE